MGVAREAPCQGQVGVQRKCAFKEDTRLRGTLVQKAADVPSQGQSPPIAWIQQDSPFGQRPSALGRGDRIVRPTLADQKYMPIC